MPLSFTRKAPVPLFDSPREICTTGRTPRCNWFQFSIHPAKPISIFPFVRDAAGCRTPDRRSRAGGRPEVRAPCDLRSGSRPWRSPDQECIGVEPGHPASSLARLEHFLRAAPATFAVSLVIAEGNRRIGRLADMPLVRQWQVGCHSNSLQASLRACGAIHGGVVLSKHAWLSDTYGFQHHPRRRG